MNSDMAEVVFDMCISEPDRDDSWNASVMGQRPPGGEHYNYIFEYLDDIPLHAFQPKGKKTSNIRI